VHKQQALATLERHPRDVKSLSKLGYIAWSEQDYDEAIRRFQQVLAIDPRHAAAYVHLGVSYAAQERHAASIAAYREAGRLQPDLATLVTQSIDLSARRRAAEHPTIPRSRAGQLYAGDGRSDRAVECFERSSPSPSAPASSPWPATTGGGSRAGACGLGQGPRP
jgi:tetratricopeptide (TPR) repeat protein